MMNKQVYALDYQTFNRMMEDRNITDENVHEWPNQAFIQIHGELSTPEEGFHFKKNHPNVLTVIFDDTLEDYEYTNLKELGKVFIAKTISDEQAKELADFIKVNVEKSFLVHCHAGISRSGGTAQFICEAKDIPLEEFQIMNPYTHPNSTVVRKLRENYNK